MKKRILAISLCLLLGLSACGTRMDKTSEFLKYKDRDKTAAVEAACRAFFEENNLQGMSVGVLVDGHARFFNFGKLEEAGGPITEDTRFDLGTLTQVFTGVTYGESIYRRYLSDGSELKEIFPYLNLPLWEGESVTYGQLATHRSGFPPVPGNLPDEAAPYTYYTELDLRRWLSQAQLEHEPGTVYNPDGLDMGLLGFGLEVARRTPYEQHVKNVIMYSISMTRTTVTFPEDDDSYLASYATPHDAAGNPLPHQEYSALQGMAGFKSTAYDMMLFAWCNMNMPGTENTFTKAEAKGRSVEDQLYKAVENEAEQKITSETIGAQSVMERLYAGMKIAQDEHYSENGVSLGYGYVLDQMNDGQYIWQAGGDAGNGGYIGFVPDTASAVVVLLNNGVSARPLGEAVLSLLNGVN